MSVTKRMVCLANSRKIGERCIAGKEILGNSVAGWIRPVSRRPKGEVPKSQRLYPDGNEPQVLDIIDFPLVEARSSGCQTENWLIATSEPRVYRGQLTWGDLGRFADPDESIWKDLSRSKFGLNDRIEAKIVGITNSSLRLVHIEKLTISVSLSWPDTEWERLQVRAKFQHFSINYNLSVTDPVYEEPYFKMSEGDYELGECFLTISIGEPLDDGACYLLVAAIIEPDASRQTS